MLFKKEDGHYRTDETGFTNAYVNQMKSHLSRTIDHPNLEQYIRKIIKERMTIPKASIHDHPVYGITEKKEIGLDEYINRQRDYILTPSGAVYMTIDKKKSVIAGLLEESIKERNYFKGLQFKAITDNDPIMEQNYKLQQASAKIFNNSIPGAMGSPYSFLYDIAGYNAITSIGRLCVKIGYTHTERMLSGNLYIKSVNDVIDYCTNHLKYINVNELKLIITKYNLYIPTIDDLCEYFLSSLSFYQDVDFIKDSLKNYITLLTSHERTYVYYIYCLKNLFTKNETFINNWINKFFNKDVIMTNSDVNEIFNIEEDLLNVAMSRNFDMIDRNGNIHEVIKQNPEGVLKLLSICEHMNRCLHDLSDLWTVFFVCDASLTNVIISENMVRKSVLISDTDSVIFTTSDLISWYSPDNLFSEKASDMNALLVYLISQTLEHIFMSMTTNMNIHPTHKKLIKMKNEFYMPVLVKSNLRKHYLSKIEIQEGKILPKPKLDIKGVNFKGSTISNLVYEEFDKMLHWVFSEIQANAKFSYKDFLIKIALFEKSIYDSLIKGDKKFLSLVPVKREHDYKTPLVSNYFCYMFWDHVFKDLGDFVLPNKGYVIPIKNKGTHIYNPEWRDKLGRYDNKLGQKIDEFLTMYNKKALTRMIIPVNIHEIPEILRELIDIRAIIFMNCRPFYLLMRSLGYPLVNPELKNLVLDYIQTDKYPVDIEI